MNTKLLIIQSAIRLFARRGYEGASISLISEESQLTKSSIYSHFSSKEDLYMKALDYLINFHQHYWSRKRSSLKSATTEKALSEILCNVYQTSQKETYLSVFWQLALIAPPSSFQEDVSQKMLRSKNILLTYLEEVFLHGLTTNQITSEHSPVYLAHSFYCLLEGATLAHLYDSVTDNEKLLEVMLNIFLNGINIKK
ncbi:TetR/AcrR family transcriptional regulator [Jeotgalibacillus sp. JSM ZJ347]|uniref:TetR/AcrR family transcriptional regulator n=1 Tax=Jeotgalibacillus sp. JSM ZJ347 TaxID=3342117 RepID=UPI0035A8F5A5